MVHFILLNKNLLEQKNNMEGNFENVNAICNLSYTSKSEIEESMRNLTPSNPDIGHLRILLHGPVGTGKSSFINSLNSVFQHRVITRVKTAPSSATSCTTKVSNFMPNVIFLIIMPPFLMSASMILENICASMHFYRGYWPVVDFF